MKSEEKKQNRLIGAIKAVQNALGKRKGKVSKETENRIQFSLSPKQFYLHSGLERKNYLYKRKTKRFKTNFISNRKVK